jgi:hypothetical protein
VYNTRPRPWGSHTKTHSSLTAHLSHKQNHRRHVLIVRHLWPVIASSTLLAVCHLCPAIVRSSPSSGRAPKAVGDEAGLRAGGRASARHRVGGLWASVGWAGCGQAPGGQASGRRWVGEPHIWQSDLIEDTLRRESTVIWRVSGVQCLFYRIRGRLLGDK